MEVEEDSAIHIRYNPLQFRLQKIKLIIMGELIRK